MKKQRVYVYKRFERFWHWMQALLVILLAATGFDIHYSGIEIIGFEEAVTIHRVLAWAFVILIAFAIFWHFTTGEWKQYIPTRRFVREMIGFYLVGIFRNAPHPVKKTVISKLNPLQRLTYLGLKILIIPVLVGSGFLYYFYNELDLDAAGSGALRIIALVHTFAAYLLIAFMFAHVYLTTTGHTPWSNIRAMITGWEELEDDAAHQRP
jgi:thiosulfate reductase cytochrome b subunit